MEFEPHHQTSRKLPKQHHHHRHHPKTYFNFDDDEETLRHFNIDRIEDVVQYDNAIVEYQNDEASYKSNEYLQVDQEERWPKFEEIERLAGISEWKRERWKSIMSSDDSESTTKPPSSRVQKFTYRRVQGSVNGSKRNAIIAVSAIAPRVRPKE